jgi:hypothetical protein
MNFNLQFITSNILDGLTQKRPGSTLYCCLFNEATLEYTRFKYTSPNSSTGYLPIPWSDYSNNSFVTSFDTALNLFTFTAKRGFEFPKAIEDWGVIKHIGFVFISYGSSSPELLAYGTLDTPLTIIANDIVSIKAGDLVFKLKIKENTGAKWLQL